MSEFLIIDHDGLNVGLKDFFNETYLEFDNIQDAIDVVDHWDQWLKLLGSEK